MNIVRTRDKRTFDKCIDYLTCILCLGLLAMFISMIINILQVDEIEMSKIMTPIITTDKYDRKMAKLIEKNALKDIEKEQGNTVSSEEEIQVSKFMTEYFNTLANDNFESLNNYCVSSSTLYEKDMYYRSNIQYTYDTYYNSSKAMHILARGIALNKVESVRLKDNVYTVQCKILIPTTRDISEYFRKYSYDIRYFFNVNEINSINISKVIFKALNIEAISATEKDVVFKLEANNDELKLCSDLEISEDCNAIYTECVNNIIDILKGSLN